MTCSTCNQFYNAATESDVCPHPIIASPVIEDRATAPHWTLNTEGDPGCSSCARDGVKAWIVTDASGNEIINHGHDTNIDYDLLPLMIDAANSYTASQKKIAELEAWKESAMPLLLRYDTLAGPFASLGQSKVAALEAALAKRNTRTVDPLITQLGEALKRVF